MNGNLNRKATMLDNLITAVLKLDRRSGERDNVTAFIHSCYGGRVCDYDFDAALASMDKLTEDEYRALVEHTLS